MMLLKDMRFYLIVGLAIVCLFTLKTCSTVQGGVGSVDDLDADDLTADESAVANRVVANRVVEVQPAVEDPEVQQVVEMVQEASTTEQAAVVPAKTTSAGESAPVAVIESDTSNDSEIAVAAVVTEAETAVVTETETAIAVNAMPVVLPEMPPIAVQKIILREPAATGSAVADLKADISSLENGMYKYSEKSERIGALMDKIKGVTQ